MVRTAMLLMAAAVCLSACGGSSGGGSNTPPPPPTELLDQSVVPNPPTQMFPIGAIDCAQTFITAAAGQLTRVEVMLSTPPMTMGTLRVDVRPAPGGVPIEDDATVLGFVEINVSTLPAVPTMVSFDLTGSPIIITASQPLAIVARRVAGMGDIATIWGAGNVYGNGSAWRRGGVWVQNPATDFGFQTFVLP